MDCLFSDGIVQPVELKRCILITLVNHTQRTLFLLSTFLSGHDCFLQYDAFLTI